MQTVSLTIDAIKRDGRRVAPATKKNSPIPAQIKSGPRAGRFVILPSAAYTEWANAARGEFLRSGKFYPRDEHRQKLKWLAGESVSWRVNCRALIYREKDIGDATGYYDAIGDFLELAGLVVNDRYLRSWDGSRLLIDKSRPRVEVELTPLEGATFQPCLIEEADPEELQF